ncbi:hypothetical protein HNP99_002130 [Flavobacterium sp. 28A]|uniref:PAS domain-containing hybrid sensor histidine kinase/response regulator n=1 Tax=Flavobacterium sp. 28A TaxID=2735895 RepID=UPI00156E0892|nr:PAS domain-containing hybrid sensor histidine kinase/response regulator [Flavobacterium sp. 28A]NRT15770.1 hypothetical protein [Flavobacterium sp. 28A]
MQNELSKIKDEVVNKIVVMSAIFFIPPYIFSLLRWFEIGWQDIYVFHSLLYFSVLALAIFRKKLNYFQKTVLISLLYLTISLIGLVKFALNGGFYYSIIAMAILAILTKRKFAIYVNIIIIILFSFVAIGYSNYTLNPSLDLNLLARSPSHWFLTLSSIFSITIIFIYGFGDFYRNLTETIIQKEETTTKLLLQNELLETSEKKYQLIFDGANDAIFLLLENRVFDCNQTACDYFKINKATLIGMELDKLSPDFQYDGQNSTIKAQQIIKQVLNNHSQKIQWQNIKSNGVLFDTSISLNKITIKGKDYVQGILRDITDKKRNEEALKASENKFKSLFENSADGILVLNEKSEILELNNQICEILGYDCEELLLLKVNDIIHTEDMIRKDHNASLQELLQGKTVISQYRLCKKNGDYIYTELSTKKIAEGQYLNIVRDITEKKKIIDELIIAKEKAEESDRLKSAFLANISHEIRTPMNGILGFSELLKEPNLTGGEQRKYIKIIEKSGNRMLNIINNIVDLSKIEAGLVELTISETNINAQIEYACTFFKPEADKKGIQLIQNTTLSNQAATINTDREKLYSILLNLIKNAIKYSDTGTIEVGYNLKNSATTDYIEFYVSDTGIGVPIDQQESIFKRFIQADISDREARHGAGLGLSISKAFVEIMGGKIRVESKEDKGSIFYFTMPYSPTNEIKKRKSGETLDFVIPEKLKILIAEDDEISKKLLTFLLAPIATELLVAKNGEEAVEIYKTNQDIDIILMDIQMPVLDGFEATKQIRLLNKEVKIIAQTAFALSGDEEKIKNAGCNTYIYKPIKKENLFLALKENI